MLIPGALGEILVSARTTGKLTLLDRYGLKAAILDESLSEDEQRSIDRLLRAVVKGRVAVDPLPLTCKLPHSLDGTQGPPLA
ncbi:MAG: hypothetical protein R6U67_03630 [Sodalinema sp.]|uniref:hypothetical protein n=1 Tax=Sodalinema sp. TaxID=3080550 RepID=UPI0011F6DE69|nr:MAG: hypothetical protein EYR95_06880 [Phormidium sp. SL48-SHIP]